MKVIDVVINEKTPTIHQWIITFVDIEDIHNKFIYKIDRVDGCFRYDLSSLEGANLIQYHKEVLVSNARIFLAEKENKPKSVARIISSVINACTLSQREDNSFYIAIDEKKRNDLYKRIEELIKS